MIGAGATCAWAGAAAPAMAPTATAAAASNVRIRFMIFRLLEMSAGAASSAAPVSYDDWFRLLDLLEDRVEGRLDGLDGRRERRRGAGHGHVAHALAPVLEDERRHVHDRRARVDLGREAREVRRREGVLERRELARREVVVHDERLAARDVGLGRDDEAARVD